MNLKNVSNNSRQDSTSVMSLKESTLKEVEGISCKKKLSRKFLGTPSYDGEKDMHFATSSTDFDTLNPRSQNCLDAGMYYRFIHFLLLNAILHCFFAKILR